jgi:ketosteroid isomerase-like protein
MSHESAAVHNVLHSINAAWREGHPLSMLKYLHPEITMVLPKFTGTVQGRDTLIASFEEFCKNAKIIEYKESDESISVIGDCAIATYCFQMIYERSAYREDSQGRDLWVFRKQGDDWVAVWRTMLDLAQERVSSSTPS